MSRPAPGARPVLAKIREAWALEDADLVQERLGRLASELDGTGPDAAGSLREGLSMTPTLMRLGITGARSGASRTCAHARRAEP